jgi:hypothetical protein
LHPATGETAREWFERQYLQQPAPQQFKEPAPIRFEDDFDPYSGDRHRIGKIRLACGHMYQVKLKLDRWTDRSESRYVEDELTSRLRHAEKKHDCATHERDELVKRITAKLTRQQPRR